MKNKLIQLIESSIQSLIAEQVIPESISYTVNITPTKQQSHGDYACNIALVLAKPANTNPRQLANEIIARLPKSSLIKQTDIAGPGFINFFLNNDAQFSIIETVLDQQENFGRSQMGQQQKVNVEFVSANPTGPLHVGHGRGAAIGSAISSLLTHVGYNVTREYYVNDAGRQMDILAVSVWLRYLELQNIAFHFPSNGYKGEYIYTIAQSLIETAGKKYLVEIEKVFANISDDYDPETESGDKEKHIDGLTTNAKQLLGHDYHTIHSIALNAILDDIKEDLSQFAVEFDEWFSEKSLMTSGAVSSAIEKLSDNNLLYENNGAKWFKSESLGDEKDRVVVRDNGQTTYFASDAAYMKNKFDRGFNKLVYLFGADHHGYIPRLMALAKAFKLNPEQISIPLVQFAVLYRGGEQVQMSTRSGSFVTLRDLRKEVGTDAARFFYIMRKADQHLDFDLDLAKSKSNENPVYYIQYAHARICSVFRQTDEQNITVDIKTGLSNLDKLTATHETDLANKLTLFPEIIEKAADRLEPHLLTTYLRELANHFHSYYNSEKFIVDNNALMQARLALISAVKIVFTNALTILNISAPEKM